MMIKTFDYLRVLPKLEDDIISALRRVLKSGRLILGPETEAFEHEFAAFVGAKHCIGVHSGTTALQLALMGLGISAGDEVMTVANTCVPTVAAIELCGAHPVFVDVRAEDFMIDPERVVEAIGPKTRCLLPVHLWGQSVDIASLQQIARQHDLFLVEDCAQAQGTFFRQQHVGTFGDAGCFSFYPTKNLGAYGDAGAIVTNNDELASRLRRKRMYGYDRSNYAVEKGMNARISEMQAAILRVKLRYVQQWLERRRSIAGLYDAHLSHPEIHLPFRHPERIHSFHQYVVRCDDRPKIISTLNEHDVQFGIHYPTPIHRMPAYQERAPLTHPLPVTEQACQEILSLPIHEGLESQEAVYVANILSEAR